MKRLKIFSCIVTWAFLLGLTCQAYAQVFDTIFKLVASFQVELGLVITGDFNGDGKLDLAGLGPGYSVSVLLGDGTGSFGSAVNSDVGEVSDNLVAGDFDGDGNLDLALAIPNWAIPTPPGYVAVLLGTGTGSFGTPTKFEVGKRPLSVATADLNGDGILDLVTANERSDSVSVLLGTGNGEFAAATNFGVGWFPGDVSIGDFNGDGNLDLVTANGSGDTVSILLGTGTGSFGIATDVAAGSSSWDLAVGDVNGDGKLDIAIAAAGDYSSDHITVLLGNGDGSFSTGNTFVCGQFPRFVSMSDLDGDGNLDLVVSRLKNGGIGSNTVSILWGDGTGSFGAPENIHTAFSLGIAPSSTAVSDLNGDDNLDLVIAAYGPQTLIFLNQTPSANFRVSPRKGPPPLSVDFTDESTGEVTSWTWDFGDGSTSTERNPNHIYDDYGTYTVSFTVRGPLGSDTETKTDHINVTEINAMPWIPLLLGD